MSKQEGKLAQPKIDRSVPYDHVTPDVKPFNDFIELLQREYALESSGYFWKLIESKKI
jgi:hypothetical protein